MKLYTYIITSDTGLAPNPYGEYCSLAVCTPNHMGARADKGDWIVGFSPKNEGHQFIYAMQVEERLYMGDYFNDERFQYKKPSMSGTSQEMCGDNFYRPVGGGKLEWVKNPSHQDIYVQKKDIRHPYVFVGQNFYYLGEKRVKVDEKFEPLIGGIGIRCNHPVGLAEEFISWVKEHCKVGMQGTPQLDIKDIFHKKGCSTAACTSSRKSVC